MTLGRFWQTRARNICNNPYVQANFFEAWHSQRSPWFHPNQAWSKRFIYTLNTACIFRLNDSAHLAIDKTIGALNLYLSPINYMYAMILIAYYKLGIYIVNAHTTKWTEIHRLMSRMLFVFFCRQFCVSFFHVITFIVSGDFSTFVLLFSLSFSVKSIGLSPPAFPISSTKKNT